MADPTVRVVSLQASNILRLSAVDIKWDNNQRVLTLGGKNGAGKSSVVNSVAMALGGEKLCPDEPLKRGETRGFVELNLGDLVVRREFWRDLLTEQTLGAPPAYGETKSRLTVKNAEGVKQEPAQRLLDKLVGKMTFDPTAFASEDEKKQADILRKLIGLDFSDHDEQRQIAYDRRTIYNKEYKEKLVLLNNFPVYDNVPDEEVSVSEIADQLTAAEAARKAHVAAVNEIFKASQNLSAKETVLRITLGKVAETEAKIAELQRYLVTLQEEVTQCSNEQYAAVDNVNAARQRADQLQAAIPDTAAINARLHEVEDINSKVRANASRRAVMNSVVAAQNKSEEQDLLITSLDEKKAQTLRDAQYPIEGLSINHSNAVLFNGVSLKQASTAEQIRVSVAIGFALNPALKLLCVKNGNALDEDSFKLIADAAEKAGGQVLMEIVTKNANDVSVFIEDGHNA